MTKFSPFTIASAVTLDDTSLAVVGAPVRIPAMERATLWITYASVDSDARLSMAVEVHRSPSESVPAPNDNGWSRVPVLNGSSYDAGTVDADALAVRFAAVVDGGTVTFNYPGIDVSGAWWLRVLLVVTGGAAGEASVWLTGSSS